MLANAVLHRLDRAWTERHQRLGVLIRYADDAVVHCASRRQAEVVLAGITKRMAEVGLRLHPDKTHIV
ncbi:MAG: hypothetical protein LC799_34375 [Actinobacteria bacterium]|nr:hypothetical protein [Actinomycetota bacterium]